MCKLSAAEDGPLDDYEEGMRQLTAAHPNHWSTILVADDHMRHERFLRLREEIEWKVANGTFTGLFDPQRPWEAVVAYAAYGTGHDERWWFRQVEKPCMTASPDNSAATAAAIEGSSGLQYLEDVRDGVERRQSLSSVHSPPPRIQRRLDRREAAAAQGGRPDGRFLTDSDNTQLCFAWNRSATGCSEVCTSRTARAHKCEWCLDSHHRAVDDKCPSRNRPAGWRPEPKGSGRGGGRSKDGGHGWPTGRGQKRKYH